MTRIAFLIFFLIALFFPGLGADRFSVATGSWSQTSTWSATSGGTPGASVPGPGDNAFVEGGFTVTMDAAVTTSNVTVKSASTLDAASFKLIVNSTFTVEGEGTFKQGGSEVSVPGATKILASTSTYIFYGTQAGLSGTFPTYGNLIFQPSPAGPGTFAGNLTVMGDLTISLGTVQEIRFATGATSRTHYISGNLNIQGNSIVVGNNGTTASSIISVGGNLLVGSGTFRGTNSNGSVTVNIAGNITNNATWQLDDGSSSGVFHVVLNGSSTTQTIDGTNPISFENLTLNNPSGITLGRNFTVTLTLSLINGSVFPGNFVLSYGTGGTLTYDGSSYLTTSNEEFPSTDGPANLNVNNCNAGGISLHANRTLPGNLTIAPGKIFNVPAGVQLTVCGTTTTNGGVVLKSPTGSGPAGSFIPGGSASGNITAERFINAWSNYFGWHFLSSPVASQAIQPGFVPDPPASSVDFYKWDEEINTWINSKSASGSWNGSFENNFCVGTGYMVAYQTASTKLFTGVPNFSNVPVSGLSLNTGSNGGWHLLGNPFPSALEWNGGDWSLINIAATAKIWDESTASYSDIHDVDHDIIPAMNGFMVQVTTAPGSLLIPASARTHSGSPWFKNSEEFIILTARETEFGTAQETHIRINGVSTEGYDMAYDSRFLTGYAPQFYSVAGEERLSTNTLPDLSNERIIDLGFINNSASNYTIELNTINMIPGLVVYLMDKKTQLFQNLIETPAYSFVSNGGDDPARFQLHFSKPFGIKDGRTHNSIEIYSSGKSIYVSNNTSPTNAGEAFVYNMMGKIMIQKNLTGAKLTILQLKTIATGYYVVKIITREDTFFGKVFLH